MKSGWKVIDGAKKLVRNPLHAITSAASAVGKMFWHSSDNLSGDPPADLMMRPQRLRIVVARIKRRSRFRI